MRLQDLGFPGFGYAPWGAGTPVVTNPGGSNTAAGTQPGVSSGSTTNGLDVGGNGSAAAASLNTDPGEIAGFSMRLSYSSTLVQRAPAANTTSGAPVTSDPPAANPASPQQIITNFIQTVMAKLGRGSDDSDSHLRISSRWKLHLLAQALPAYAQAQAADADAPRTTTTTTASTTPAAAAQNAPPTAVQAATSAAAATPRVASNRYPTLQAARLAADTLSQLAQ
jgi:hypothetical protein